MKDFSRHGVSFLLGNQSCKFIQNAVKPNSINNACRLAIETPLVHYKSGQELATLLATGYFVDTVWTVLGRICGFEFGLSGQKAVSNPQEELSNIGMTISLWVSFN